MSRLRGLSVALRLAPPLAARSCRCAEHAVLPALNDPAQRSAHLLARSAVLDAQVSFLMQADAWHQPHCCSLSAAVLTLRTCSAESATGTQRRWRVAAQVWQGSFAVRPISSSTAALQQQKQRQDRTDAETSVRLKRQQEEDALTDQIPLRPMGKVEGASYTVIIVLALGLAGELASEGSSSSFHNVWHARLLHAP